MFQILVAFDSHVQVTPSVTRISWETQLSAVLTSNYGGPASLVGLAPALTQCQINGTGVVNNKPAVPSTTTASFSGNSVNFYAGPIPNSPNVSTIGYLMTFSLSGHSTAVFSGSWYGTVVPAPGVMALFSLVGLAGRRRRR